MYAHVKRSAIALICLSLTGLASTAGTAVADPYTPPEVLSQEPAAGEFPLCPPAPELPPEPEPTEEDPEPDPVDPILVELRQLRIATSEACDAVQAQILEVVSRSWWQTAELVQAGPISTATNAKLDQLLEAPNCGDPCKVKQADSFVVNDTASKQYSDALISAVDSSGEASKAGTWFLIAIVLMGFIAYPLYKVFIFWRSHV